MPYCRSDLDVATLHGDDLTGKVQSDTDALNIVYFFFPVKAFEDHALSALSYPFAAVRNVDLHIELPTLNRNLNIAMSSALRELHDNGEIELKYGSDQEMKWFLYPSKELFDQPVSSIVFKGVKS